MITTICFILFLFVFFRLLGVAFKVGWGVFKISMFLIFFPVVVLTTIFGGLFFIALPVLLIAAVAGMAARA